MKKVVKMTKNVWAYRIYFKRKRKVYARSEQFRTKKMALLMAQKSVWNDRIEIRKEKKSKFQKQEEKIVKNLSFRSKGYKKELQGELLIPL